MRTTSTLAVLAAVLAIMPAANSAEPRAGTIAGKPDAKQVERGRYLVKIAGCNDCHTPGYMPAEGKVDEKLWLTGDALGWRGPWGTTYASNLRLTLQPMSETAWIQFAKSAKMRPPMPWFALHAMTKSDLSAIYHYIKSLPVMGDRAPAFVPPGEMPRGPYVQLPG